MINLELYQHKGCLQQLTARGHALKGSRGNDMVCGSVTSLIRSAGRLLQDEKGFSLDVKSSGRGDLYLEVLSYSEDKQNWLQGVTALLIKGLKDICDDYPEAVKMKINLS